MKEETLDKVNKTTEVVNIMSGMLAEVNPGFLGIPIITFVINRVTGFVSERNIINRIKKLEKRLIDKKINIESFKEKVFQLSEHNEYIVRNNLNNLLLNAIPEVVDVYIELIIELIMNQENSIYEEICEILTNLNANDLELLKMIKNCKTNGVKKEFEKNLERERKLEDYNKEIDKKNKEIEEFNKSHKMTKIKYDKFYERNFKKEDNTIFWKDFIETYQLNSGELSFILLYKTVNEMGEESMEWAFIARAFLKLEKLGIIQMEYLNTLGTINSLNIDRFHINIFGQELLKYI